MISVVIPCFNQGRFLTECLESVAVQTLMPHEVVLVNDGSTDPDTGALCSRLALYSYPFPLRVIEQENRGLPAARNTAIQYSTGDVILPLDADDKLLPHALEEFERFLADHPDIDICYPDVMFHGTTRWNYVAPLYNRWRHTQHNWFVPCTAIRRRAFDAGHQYCPRMRRGYEDWEFWHRTCILGPFRAAPLGKQVFGYRKWGYSMLSATNHDEQLAEIRRRQSAAGLWSHATVSRLRTQFAPSHCRVTASAPPHEDTTAVPAAQLNSFLKTDYLSRFVWFGDLPPRDPLALRLLIAHLARTRYAPLYVFLDEGRPSPYLIVLDRLAALEVPPADFFTPGPVARAVHVHTRGQRHVWPASVRDEPAWAIPPGTPLAPLLRLPSRSVLPEARATDLRLAADMYYYFRRDFLAPAFPHPDTGTRTLAVALSDLSPGPVVQHLLALLEQSALRDRFDLVYLFTLLGGEHAAHSLVEPLVDGIYHPAALGLGPELVLQFLTESAASDLLIVDSLPGLDLIPPVRAARLPVRITAAFAPAPARPPQPDPVQYLASQYANLVDRVAASSPEMVERMTDHLYFPAGKVRYVEMGPEWIDWLFPADSGARDYASELFGVSESKESVPRTNHAA